MTRKKRVEKVVVVPPFDLLNVLKRPLEEIGDDALAALHKAINKEHK